MNHVPYEEEAFQTYMDATVRPWLDAHVQDGMFTSTDGTRLHYYRALHPNARAVIVMVHGFCEFFGKYHETAYDFYEGGYSVYFLEQRGHGGSNHAAERPYLVDVNDFSEYVEDLKCLLGKVVVPENSGLLRRAIVQGQGGTLSGRGGEKLPLLLYAHSMGGCVSTLFLERYPDYFKAAVLSSPMLKINNQGLSDRQARLVALGTRLLHRGDKPFPGGRPFDGTPDLLGSGSVSKARYDYQFALRTDPATHERNTMNAGTWRWLWAAMRATQTVRKTEAVIRIPLLICQAGHDAFVDNAGQNELAQNAPDARLRVFPEAKHEIYCAGPDTLERYYDEIFAFYEENGN